MLRVCSAIPLIRLGKNVAVSPLPGLGCADHPDHAQYLQVFQTPANGGDFAAGLLSLALSGRPAGVLAGPAVALELEVGCQQILAAHPGEVKELGIGDWGKSLVRLWFIRLSVHCVSYV